MKRAMLTTDRAGASLPLVRRMMTIGAIGAGVALAGCISVKAPDKPIEINLNVNIRQEVVVSLRKDVADLDRQYPGVFE